MSTESARQDDPDKLWEMIDAKDQQIAELKVKVDSGHWYDANSGRGDSYAYHCKCGYKRYEKAKLDSHISWELAALKSRAPLIPLEEI